MTVNKLSIAKSRVTGGRVIVSASTSGTGVAAGIDNSGKLSLVGSTVSNNKVDVRSRSGSATTVGAGVYESGNTTAISRSTIDENTGTAESSSSGAVVDAVGLQINSKMRLTASTVSRNVAQVSAHGANSAIGAGAGLDVRGPYDSAITISTIASNLIHGTSGAGAGSVTAIGGGIVSYSNSVLVTNATVARNLVGGSANAVTRLGGGIGVGAGTVKLASTILALNNGAGSPNCSGAVNSGGHNLLGSPSGCTFGSKSSDKLNKNPKLGALANNGGPTLTLALQTGSPALNAIPKSACAVPRDQRGVKRPQGPGCDIGAYERKA